jgi:hypothetical protein
MISWPCCQTHEVFGCFLGSAERNPAGRLIAVSARLLESGKLSGGICGMLWNDPSDGLDE